MNIDLYCERLASGVWQEPVNTLSNAAFFVSAWAALRFGSKFGGITRQSATLVVLLVCIAAGSSLFHLFGTTATVLLDVIPILLYQVTYLVLYLTTVANRSRAEAFAGILGFVGLAILGRFLPPLPSGSSAYLPAFFLLLILGAAHAVAGRRERWSLLAAALLFFISIGFRSADGPLCPTFPLGTHFLWHLLNAGVLYLTMRAFLANSTK